MYGGGRKSPIITLLKQQKMITGSNVEYENDCYIGDIIVIYNFSYTANDGYATPLVGCTLVDTFYVGHSNQKQPITILRATANHIKFKIVDSYIAGSYAIFSKFGDSITTTIEPIAAESSTRRQVTKNINSDINDIIVIPNIYESSIAIVITYTNLDYMSDNYWAGGNSAMRIMGYRANTNNGSSVTLTNFEVGSYILLH